MSKDTSSVLIIWRGLLHQKLQINQVEQVQPPYPDSQQCHCELSTELFLFNDLFDKRTGKSRAGYFSASLEIKARFLSAEKWIVFRIRLF